MSILRAQAASSGVQLARLLKRVKIVTATDVGIADEDLRHRAAAIGALDHFRFAIRLRQHVNFRKCNTFLVQQPLGSVAEAAERRGVDFDRFHSGPHILVSKVVEELGIHCNNCQWPTRGLTLA